MPGACEMLTAAGENFVFATQNAQVNNFNQKARKHLIRAAKDVLEGTLKVNRLRNQLNCILMIC